MAKKAKAAAKKRAATKTNRKQKTAAKSASAVRPGSKEDKSQPTPVPAEAAFKSLINKITDAEKDKNDAVGRVGGLISAAVDKIHVDKKALSVFRSLKKMSNRKLATTLLHLEHYCEIGGLNDRATEQGELVGREQELAEAKIETIPAGRQSKKTAAKKAAAEPEPQQSETMSTETTQPKSRKTRGLTKAQVKAVADRAEASSKVVPLPVRDALEDDGEPMGEYSEDEGSSEIAAAPTAH